MPRPGPRPRPNAEECTRPARVRQREGGGGGPGTVAATGGDACASKASCAALGYFDDPFSAAFLAGARAPISFSNCAPEPPGGARSTSTMSGVIRSMRSKVSAPGGSLPPRVQFSQTGEAHVPLGSAALATVPERPVVPTLLTPVDDPGESRFRRFPDALPTLTTRRVEMRRVSSRPGLHAAAQRLQRARATCGDGVRPLVVSLACSVVL